MKWFGESWGAPACDPEDHGATPVGAKCSGCGIDIREGDQGIRIPFMGLWEEQASDFVDWHLDCWLAHIRPHDFSCPRCRGKQDRKDHEMSCGYGNGGECSCYPTWRSDDMKSKGDGQAS
jgi:hypothetical protein